MFNLLYRSKSKGFLTEVQIEEILSSSRANNAKKGITGLLLYRDKVFVQLLEGQKETVMELYEKISKDPRHTNVEIVYCTESGERLFKDWSMGHIKEDFIVGISLNTLAPFIEAAASYGKLDRGLIKAFLKTFISANYQTNLF